MHMSRGEREGEWIVLLLKKNMRNWNMKAASAYLICILSKIQLLHRAEAVLQI